jgi:hypothetical protein
MCKEMPVILVSKVVDPKRNNRKKWRAEEEAQGVVEKNFTNERPLVSPVTMP